MPYVIVGDEAFPLKPNLMRPYPGKSMGKPRSQKLDGQNINMAIKAKRIFNYRLSRARRVVENSFGIMSQKWRIFRVPINADIDLVELIVQACVCLHNFLLIKKYKYYANATSIQDVDLNGTAFYPLQNKITSHKRTAAEVREEYANFFVNEGAVDWQEEMVFK